jgi:4-aminobutyrate---pyruvate transaminase
MSKVFFNNSGSEANDTAIKMVWYYNNALGRPHKKKIVSRIKAYHGVTIAKSNVLLSRKGGYCRNDSLIRATRLL